MAEFPKRPRNLNQWQKLLGAMATGFASDKQPTLEEQGKDPATVTAGGLKSDTARAESLTRFRLWCMSHASDIEPAVILGIDVSSEDRRHRIHSVFKLVVGKVDVLDS
jgi:hypothetical protein